MKRLGTIALCTLASATSSGCGSSANTTTGHMRHTAGGTPHKHAQAIDRPVNGHRTATAARRKQRLAFTPAYPRLLGSATATSPTAFVPVVSWRGQTAAWVARRPGFALVSFNQRLLELRLHSGTVDAGVTGWRYGPAITGAERRRLVAAFNGGFKLDRGAGGFESYGRAGFPLSAGLGSIVTYADGFTDIGAWRQGVPAAGKHVVSVRQNLHLMIDHGRPALDLSCLLCWGATLGGVPDPARSALGITADNRLVWAGGENLTPSALADALLAAHVVRAVELDINPEWVAAYLYGHRGGVGPLAPVAVVPGQPGVPGQFLAPYTRDFFSVVARPVPQQCHLAEGRMGC